MPYKSKAQQAYLNAKNPDVAKRFNAETPKGAYKKLPEHAKPKSGAKKGK